LRKQLSALERHCESFIALSPFVVLSTADAQGRMDASPRGGAPGFVKVLDAHTLLIPDAPGNNRLDSLSNIVETGRIGLLFLVPGVDETLRINGAARLSQDAAHMARFSAEARMPRLLIEVRVQEAYLHCAKALMRSKLWSDAARVDRACLPPMGQMINDQTGHDAPAESQAQMVARYAADL
jgi:PPOX class probable FMN-dependent enzyme